MALGTKVAVITGAGSGIGKAAARALALEGFAVILAGRNVERLDQAQGELVALAPGLPHLAVAADVTSLESVHSLFAKVREANGRLDLLFNNAGVFVPGTSLEDVAVEQWTSMIATNLTGAFLCTR